MADASDYERAHADVSLSVCKALCILMISWQREMGKGRRPELLSFTTVIAIHGKMETEKCSFVDGD